jgi:hypothetical protein
LKIVLDSFIPLRREFEPDKLVFHSKKGFQVNVPDLTFFMKSSDDLMHFESNLESLCLKKGEYAKRKNSSEESFLFSNNIKGKLVSFKKNDIHYYEAFFNCVLKEATNLIMTASSNSSERKILISNSLKTFKVLENNNIDYFTYKNTEFKFFLDFGIEFQYSEKPQVENFFTLMSEESDLAFGISKIHLSGKYSGKDLVETMKEDMERQGSDYSIQKEESRIISGKECGIIHFEYTDDIVDVKNYLISYLIVMNSEFCLKLDATMEIEDKSKEILEEEIFKAVKICDSIKFY